MLSQFFAEGQAYVAISRVRALEQLHFWCVDEAAFKVSPDVAAAYARLRGRVLSSLDGLLERHRLRDLLPLVGGAVGTTPPTTQPVAAASPAGSSVQHAAAI